MKSEVIDESFSEFCNCIVTHVDICHKRSISLLC